MSNRNLKKHIRQTIDGFEQGTISFVHLNDVIKNTGAAFEAIPYTMVQELRHIQSRLTIERGYEEDGFESNSRTAISELKKWVDRAPD